MSREKNLVKNTGILAIGQLSSKLFTFLLLPLYTSALLPEDYGTVDVLQTVMYLILYVITLQIESAIFRFIIDDRDNDERIAEYVSCGIVLVVLNLSISTVIICAINFVCSIQYLHWFVYCLWAEAIFQVFQNIARGRGHNVTYSLSSFSVTATSLVINVILILGFELGAQSILIAIILSNTIGSLVFFIRERLWHYISLKYFRKKQLMEMLRYSIPLVPNAISWWIANASDRLLIWIFLGSTVNGIYAAANKIPTIYTTIFAVYNLAWTESVSLASKDEDKEQFINSMMERSYKVLTFLILGIIVCMSLLFHLLIGDKYADSYVHIYILLVAIFINSMCSLFGAILTGFKASKIIGITTIVGAVVNFSINIVLIQVIGLYAASISTLVSYIVILCVRIRLCKKFVNVKFPLSFSVQFIIALAVVTGGYFSRSYLVNGLILIILIIWGIYNNRDIAIGVMDEVKKRFVR